MGISDCSFEILLKNKLFGETIQNKKEKYKMTTYSLPNLYTNPNVKLSYIINKKQYTFLFRWLEDFAIVSIYIRRNGVKTYLVSGRAIVPDMDLIARVKDQTLITGKLVIKNKYDEDMEITQENFHTDFEMEYYE